MTTVTYMDLLRDPRWQRRRLEIMQRDKFRCRSCKDETTTLNVHHSYYVSGRKPWDYSDDELHTLCEPCHAAATKCIKSIQLWLGFMSIAEMQQVRAAAIGVLEARYPAQFAEFRKIVEEGERELIEKHVSGRQP